MKTTFNLLEAIENGTGLTQAQTKLGENLVELLGLKVNEHGRYNTSIGDKTALGLYLTVKRVVQGRLI